MSSDKQEKLSFRQYKEAVNGPINALEWKLELALGALRYYGDPANWECKTEERGDDVVGYPQLIQSDNGDLARAVVARIEGNHE